MKDRPWFAVVYMFFVTAFFSSVVIGFAHFTSDRVEANRQLAFERSVLEVFGLAEGKSSVQIHQIFVDRVSVPESPGGTYLLTDDGEVKGYAFVISGKGFWAPIKGVVGIKPDKRTLSGVSFFEQNETPGLGGEIAEEEFCSQFAGIIISSSGDAIGIESFGSVLKSNQVHAITGATQTCSRLEKFLNEQLAKWRGDGGVVE